MLLLLSVLHTESPAMADSVSFTSPTVSAESMPPVRRYASASYADRPAKWAKRLIVGQCGCCDVTGAIRTCRATRGIDRYLGTDHFHHGVDGVLTRAPGELLLADGGELLAEQRPDALVRGVADRRQVVAALEGHDHLAAGELHQLAGHVAEARRRHPVAAERRRVPARRVEPRRHQHDLRVEVLQIANRTSTINSRVFIF